LLFFAVFLLFFATFLLFFCYFIIYHKDNIIFENIKPMYILAIIIMKKLEREEIDI